MRIFRLLYVSTALVAPHTVAPAILRVSRRDNVARGITGCLLCTRSNYAQVLEGATDAVMTLIGRIATDPRHQDVHIVSTRNSSSRLYASWAMAYAPGAPLEAFLWETVRDQSRSALVEEHLMRALRPSLHDTT